MQRLISVAGPQRYITFNIEVDGFYGDKVMTRSAYHGQLLRCEHIASELHLKAPHIKLSTRQKGALYQRI